MVQKSKSCFMKYFLKFIKVLTAITYVAYFIFAIIRNIGFFYPHYWLNYIFVVLSGLFICLTAFMDRFQKYFPYLYISVGLGITLIVLGNFNLYLTFIESLEYGWRNYTFAVPIYLYGLICLVMGLFLGKYEEEPDYH